jgi:diguanylate cyclase (GGDEF)-like protein
MPPAFLPRSTKPSLTLWLFASAVLVTLAAVLSAAAWIDGLVRTQARADALHYLQGNAQALRDTLDRGMGQHLQDVVVLGSLQQVARARQPGEARAAMDRFKAAFPQFAWVGLTDPQGRVVAASDGLLEGVDVSARPWFKGAQQGVFVGDVHRAVLLEKLLPPQNEPWRFVDFALPLRDEQGRPAGVLGAHLSWQWAGALQQELADRLSIERGVEALVVGAGGEVLLGPQGTVGHALQAGTPGYLWAEAGSVGHGAFRSLGWKVVLRQPVAMAMAPYDRLHGQTLAVAIAVCLLATPLLWWIARRLSAPLVGLTRTLRDPTAAPPRSGGLPYREAHLLQQALAQYDARHREQAAELKQWAQSLEERVAERTAALAQSEAQLRTVADDLRQAERRMAELALNDSLTGLANRRRFDERLPEALARARRQHSGTALLFLDVDRFKAINDTHGHAVGDAVLAGFARRLRKALRGTDFVARLAGDEFVAVLEGLHEAAEAELVAGKVVQAARRPLATPAGPLRITTSVGVAYLPPEVACSAEALLALADQALYRTKRQGRDGHACEVVQGQPAAQPARAEQVS